MKLFKIRKTMLAIAATLVASAVLLVTPAAEAHHSFTMFDQTKTISLEGTVTRFEWTNPHSFVFMNVVNDKGETVEWGLEGMSPNYLGRRGWNRHTLEPGDKITAVTNPLKDGTPGGILLRFTKEDGKTFVNFGGGNYGAENGKGKGKGKE